MREIISKIMTARKVYKPTFTRTTMEPPAVIYDALLSKKEYLIREPTFFYTTNDYE